MRDGRCSWPGRAALSAEERRGEVELLERFERCLRGGDAGRLERHGEVERVHGDVGVGELVGVLSEDLSVDFKAGLGDAHVVVTLALESRARKRLGGRVGHLISGVYPGEGHDAVCDTLN